MRRAHLQVGQSILAAVISAMALLAMGTAYAQQRHDFGTAYTQQRNDQQYLHDQYLYEKIQDQEKHIDNTDSNVKENGKIALQCLSRLDRDEGYAGGFAGALLLIQALGLLRNFQKKKEQVA